MTNKSDLREKYQQLREEQQKVGKRIGELRNHHGVLDADMKWIEQQIRMLNMQPRVSDHALLRYLERVKGIDLDQIRAEILANGVSDAIKAGVVSIKRDGFRYIASRDGVITTVLAPGMNGHTRND